MYLQLLKKHQLLCHLEFKIYHITTEFYHCNDSALYQTN